MKRRTFLAILITAPFTATLHRQTHVKKGWVLRADDM